ncbi:hypothetical protein N9Y87_01845 [Planktomarina temperata]|nr:hypothetical protein [Planktomarina temperata]
MAPKISYLFQSKTGFFEYRRRVPPSLQEHFPRSSKGKLLAEWKKALDTKIESVALRRWAAENERFEDTKRIAEQLSHGEAPKTQGANQSAISSAKHTAIKYGVHPLPLASMPPTKKFKTFRKRSKSGSSRYKSIKT